VEVIALMLVEVVIVVVAVVVVIPLSDANLIVTIMKKK